MKCFILLFIIITLVSCDIFKRREFADVRLDDIWALETLNGRAIRAKDFPRGVPNLELRAYNPQATGFGGCNSFGAPLSFMRDSMRFGALTATRKACAEDVNTVEYEFFHALDGAVKWELEGVKLTLRGRGGVTAFKKVD